MKYFCMVKFAPTRIISSFRRLSNYCFIFFINIIYIVVFIIENVNGENVFLFLETSRIHQFLIKVNNRSYSLGKIESIGRKTVTIKFGGKIITAFNDEFKDYQPIDLLRSPSDEAIQATKK